MPAMVDRVVWKKVTKEAARMRWDRKVEKVWKETGGNQDEILPIARGTRRKS